MSKFKYDDRVIDPRNGMKGVILAVLPSGRYKVGADITYGEVWDYYGEESLQLDPNMRVKATVRLEGGRVWIDTTFDDCKLQSVLIYSGDLKSAQAIYDGRLRLTADSRLVDSESGDVRP